MNQLSPQETKSDVNVLSAWCFFHPMLCWHTWNSICNAEVLIRPQAVIRRADLTPLSAREVNLHFSFNHSTTLVLMMVCKSHCSSQVSHFLKKIYAYKLFHNPRIVTKMTTLQINCRFEYPFMSNVSKALRYLTVV